MKKNREYQYNFSVMLQRQTYDVRGRGRKAKSVFPQELLPTICPVVGAFAEKINLLADSPQLRHEIGEYNRSKVEKMFTLDRMVNEYHELFEKALN